MTRSPSALQHPAGLGAGVVELAGLADDDRPRADHQACILMSVALRHQRPPLAARLAALHQVDEPVEQVAASCGPAAASGWYWTENAVSLPVGVAQLEPLDHVVVEADVADRRDAVRRLGRRVERGVDGEAVVVGGDLDLAGGAVHHRLVDAAVAVLELVGAEAERAAEELVAEADPEVGDAVGQRALQQLDLAGRRGRVAGAVGEEQPVGADRRARRRGSRWPAGRAPRCPRSAIRCGVIDLMPRSSAATVNRFSPTAGTT